MAEFGCCKRAGQRVYYLIMAIVYGVTLVVELVTLGTFGVQFSNTRRFWRDNVDGNGLVCMLYGSDDSSNNPRLGNNASCGFTLWGLVTVIIVLVVWTVFHIIMALLGRPKITSLFRIMDLIMASLMFFLSLIISSVLTDGLARTCRNTGSDNVRCREKYFQDLTDSNNRLGFFGNLDAAKDTSWTVTIVFVILIGWYIMLLVMHCCISKYRKEEKLEEAAEERKKKKSEMADVVGEDEQQESKKIEETVPQDDEEKKD